MACYYVMLSGSLFQALYLWQPQDKGVGRDWGEGIALTLRIKNRGPGDPDCQPQLRR